MMVLTSLHWIDISNEKNECHVKNPSMSLSLTLSKYEKVEEHIKNKTHKPNVSRLWIECDIISLCEFDLVLILV